MNFILKHPQLCINAIVLPLFLAWIEHVNAWSLMGAALLGSLPVYLLFPVYLYLKYRKGRRDA